jgi:alpha-ribazole phosphatase
MKVYVARHAETNYNVLGLCNDSPEVNVYLTNKGIEQGKQLAETLRSAHFDLVITSDLPRTKETARLLNEHHGAPVIADSRINDVVTGFEGRPVEEFRKARRAAADSWTVRLNGGESFEDEKARVHDFLNDLRKRLEECILVVTHQAIARLIYAAAHNLPNDEVNRTDVGNTHCFDVEL